MEMIGSTAASTRFLAARAACALCKEQNRKRVSGPDQAALVGSRLVNAPALPGDYYLFDSPGMLHTPKNGHLSALHSGRAKVSSIQMLTSLGSR
jgi:hypothetical protein